MPKMARELTSLAVPNLRKPGRHAVGGIAGLCLNVVVPRTCSGKLGISRAWVLRIVLDGKRSELGFGPYPEVSLATARERAREYRQQVRGGPNPLAERRAERAEQVANEKLRQYTFAVCAETYIADHRAGWKNKKHAYQWTQTIEQYANPTIGKLWDDEDRYREPPARPNREDPGLGQSEGIPPG